MQKPTSLTKEYFLYLNEISEDDLIPIVADFSEEEKEEMRMFLIRNMRESWINDLTVHSDYVNEIPVAIDISGVSGKKFMEEIEELHRTGTSREIEAKMMSIYKK